MPTKHRCSIGLVATLLLTGCGADQDYAYVVLTVTENASGEPVAEASVDYVPVSRTALGDADVERYLDEHGRSAGETDADGRFQIWVSATYSGPLWNRQVALEDTWLVRVDVDGEPETIVIESASNVSERGFFAFMFSEAQGDRFTVRPTTIDTTNPVDSPLPNVERSGYSRVTLEILDTATEEPISGAAVEFVTASYEQIGDLSPDEFLDQADAFVGTTNGSGHLHVQVFTRIPPLRNCALSTVGDLWIARVSAEGRTETIVFDTENESLWSVTEAHGPTISIRTPYSNCLNEGGG